MQASDALRRCRDDWTDRGRPPLFPRLRLENERQHTDLGNLIDQMRIDLSGRLDNVISELRIIKAICLGIFGTVSVSASKFVIGW